MDPRPDPEAGAAPAAPEPDTSQILDEAGIEAIEAEALETSISEILEVEETRGMILSAPGVTKRFGGLVAVHDINFDIPEGSIISLIGPNGAGKTTFFNIIAGIYDPTGGRIAIQGKTMVARPIRPWLEPILWVGPAVLVGIMTGLAVLSTGNDLIGLGGAIIAL